MGHIECSNSKNAIAVIGMAGRFPQSNSLDEFWQNLANEKELTTFFTDKKLIEEGIPEEQLKNQNYVKAKAIIDNPFHFDASFFDINENQAKIMDPQRRILLECAWEALENAAYNPDQFTGKIGVYVGQTTPTYLLSHLLSNQKIIDTVGDYILMLQNEKDFLATTLSYKLNLKGPSITIQTACSTSLMAVHMACQDLLSYSCDIAIAGGVSLTFPHNVGYLYENEMIFSPDGHCRAFDRDAQGIIPGEGAGIVVLKRAEEAIEDKDRILAFILGSAANNDGATKVGYTAPSIEGQSAVISEAHAIAEITAESISYVETHGTGTKLGDPIEITALSQVFEKSTPKKNFCALGSLKTNMGHADAAAGVLSLIKTILALQHKTIPASLNFSNPNPKINFSKSPFFVNSKTRKWDSNGVRRAGVSSFGIGGTNVHLVLEESLVKTSPLPINQNDPYLLLLSARSTEALQKMRLRLANFLENNPKINLSEVAYTLATGRKSFEHRNAFIVASIEDAIAQLRNSHKKFKREDSVLESEVNLINAAAAWEKKDIDNLDNLYLSKKLSKISLPTYPFQRKELFIPRKSLSYQKNEIESSDNFQSGLASNIISPHLIKDNFIKKAPAFSDREIELIIEKECKSFFDISSIDPKMKFSSFGHDSLVEIKLINNISNIFNIEISPNILMSCSNYETFVLHIKNVLASKSIRKEMSSKVNTNTFANNEESYADSIIQLQPGNSNMSPMFLLPGAGGILIFGKSMLPFLNKEIPLYAIEAPKLKRGDIEIKTIEDMAAYYLSLIKIVQPKGPYNLAGSSLGGTVAFEIAQHLLEQKEKTNYLALLDTPTPWQFPPNVSFDNEFQWNLLTMHLPGLKKDVLISSKTEDEKKQFILEYFKSNGESSVTSQIIDNWFDSFKRDMDALIRYIPQYYPGTLTYILALTRVFPVDLYSVESYLKWWKLRSKHFIIQTVSQDHYAMYNKENISELANILEKGYFDFNLKN